MLPLMRECRCCGVRWLNFCNLLQVCLFTMYLRIEALVGGVLLCLMYGWMWAVCGGVCVYVHVLLRFLYIDGRMMGCSWVVV